MDAISPAWLMDEISAFERSLALRTAIEMDLFTQIGRGADTVPALARAAAKASERGIRVLCDYLTVCQHLSKRRGRYALTLNSRLYLTKDSPAYFGSVTKFLVSNEYVNAFCNLRGAVTRGGAPSTRTNWTKFARWMAPLAGHVAEFAAVALRLKSAGPIRVLDVAAGHGLYGIAIAVQNPQAEIFALDSAPVLKVASGNARKAGLTKRYHPIAGDMFRKNFDGPYDLVLAANVAHHLDEKANVKLFGKVYAALKPTGKLVLLDFVVNDDRVAPPTEASFALHLLATGSQDVYTLKEYREMLRIAQFRNIRHMSTGGHSHWMITASR